MKETCGITVNEETLKQFKQVIREKKTEGKAIYSPYLEEALENYIQEIEQETKNDSEKKDGSYRNRTEKRKTQIVNKLKEKDMVSMRLVDDYIEEFAGGSRPTLDKYRELVWEELRGFGFVENDNGFLVDRK